MGVFIGIVSLFYYINYHILNFWKFHKEQCLSDSRTKYLSIIPSIANSLIMIGVHVCEEVNVSFERIPFSIAEIINNNVRKGNQYHINNKNG